ncbi:hypothetical protein SAMN05216474_1349 [Lishizhenia tianjinensis]|uniref:Lipoprotein n=1 Tax=Lishizhenia tianjinensis TaxID=477690 RepID=A0A1I6Z123_9FLAO|nr:hypothetical protein [Lishizhenia tianjinensis]SFT56435.1 hypothetical protein SAMN05216474_1349 [Lishizhenia tianjinensis]
MNFKFNFLLLLGISLSLVACSEETTENPPQEIQEIDPYLKDPNRAFNTTFDGQLFSIPSPVQTAILLKSLNYKYDFTLLSSYSEAEKYVTNQKKALNLGVYGADLGITALYKKNNDALKYLTAIQGLSEDLGLNHSFGEQFFNRYQNNATNEDTMVVLLSEAFSKIDYEIKRTEDKNLSALILVGGWVESMYITSNLHNMQNNQNLIDRIAEQSLTVETFITLLDKYNEEDINKDLIEKFKKLRRSYAKVKRSYTYIPSTTDKEKKLTTINSRTELEMDHNIFEELMSEFNALRTFIIE